MNFIDLHLHSYFSDGIFSPKVLLKKAKKSGFKILSLTDHNTISGLEEALTKKEEIGVEVIPGVEIYTYFKNFHLHLLGYNFNWKDKNLNSILSSLQKDHLKKVRDFLKILKKRFKIDEKEVLSTKSSYLGLGEIANHLFKKNALKIKKELAIKEGEIITLPQILSKYFFESKKPLLPESEIEITKAIKMIKKAGGKAVLAHPGQQLGWRDDWVIRELKKRGIEGLEAISSHHNWINIEHYQKIARELNLFITSGSDFHGELPLEWKFPIRSQWEYFKAQVSKFNLDLIKRIKK